MNVASKDAELCSLLEKHGIKTVSGFLTHTLKIRPFLDFLDLLTLYQNHKNSHLEAKNSSCDQDFSWRWRK